MSIKMLKINQCPDPLMWYHGFVGQTVPYLGVWPGEGYKSREPAGYKNIVKFDDAEIVEVTESVPRTLD